MRLTFDTNTLWINVFLEVLFGEKSAKIKEIWSEKWIKHEVESGLVAAGDCFRVCGQTTRPVSLQVCSAGSGLKESYKHYRPCHPTMSAQKCPWHPAGSQVAGGAGQAQEVSPWRWLQAHPHRSPRCFQACRHPSAHYSVPAAGCQASRAGRCLMALGPSITSGNELRVTMMAGNVHTDKCIHIHSLSHTHRHTHTVPASP